MRILDTWTNKDVIPFVLILLGYVAVIDGVCTFPDNIRGNWISSEKGTLNFTADTIVDYPMPLTVTVSQVNFECQQASGTKYLLRSTTTFLLFGFNFYAFLCLDIEPISDYKYKYQVANDIEQTNGERVKVVVEAATLDMSTGCDRAEPYDTATFNVLIKEGALADGLVEATCPYDILHTYSNGALTSSDTTTTCTNVTLDVCTDRTQMRQKYDPTCDASLKFASEGTYICLQDDTNTTSGVTYLHVWNNDTTLTSGVNRINCYAFEQSNNKMVATLYPGACKASQTSTEVDSPGLVVEYNTITNTCQSTVVSGPETVYYMAIIFGALGFILILVIIICVTYKTKCRCITKLCKKSKIGHSEVSLNSMEKGLEPYLRNARKDQPPGIFVARKPIKLGPIIEPYLQPPPKVELLYDVEPRPSSSKLLFRSSIFLSQLSLKNL